MIKDIIQLGHHNYTNDIKDQNLNASVNKKENKRKSANPAVNAFGQNHETLTQQRILEPLRHSNLTEIVQNAKQQ